jgi:arylsulfatase A-like enzyme
MEPFRKFLVVLCDQWRAPQHWPARLPLPAYERLCAGGVSFTQATIASAACTPSRACLLSSKYAQETGVSATSGLHFRIAGRERYLGKPPTDRACILPTPGSVDNLGSLFRAGGFKTIYKGKWHLSDVEGPWPDGPAVGLEGYGFSGWMPPEGHGREPERWGLRTDPDYAREAADAIRTLARDGTDRFLVVASILNPHDIGFFYSWEDDIPDLGVSLPPNADDPLTDKPACQRRYRRIWTDGSFLARAAFERMRGKKTTRRERMIAYQQLYARLTQIADAHVGTILDALAETGQLADTCVVFTSDHGEMGLSHGLVQKWYCAYEEMLRVPLVFHNPRLSGPRRVDAPASSVDITPTLLSLAGLPQPGGRRALRGRDLSPVVWGQASSAQDAVLFATDDDIIGKGPLGAGIVSVPEPHHIRAVRTREHKLVRYFDPAGRAPDEYELYDLARDPGELTNLAAGPQGGGAREIFEDLRRRLDALVAEKYDHPPLGASL